MRMIKNTLANIFKSFAYPYMSYTEQVIAIIILSLLVCIIVGSAFKKFL